jgi:hypothetical protein
MYIISELKCKLSFKWHLNLTEDCVTQSLLLSNKFDLIIDIWNYHVYITWHKGVSMIRVDFDPISETVYIDIILNSILERLEQIFLWFHFVLCCLAT